MIAAAWGGDPSRGATLAELAGCASCHTETDGEPYSGGYPVRTRFGTFYGTNLTPDATTGLGRWTAAEFVRAMTRGRGPEGAYYPAFPYTSFSKMTDEDLADLWSYLQSLPPVTKVEQPHELERGYRGRWKIRLWRTFFYRFRPFREGPHQSDSWNRGAYLAQGLLHCGECHTPRGAFGTLKTRKRLSGSEELPHPSPNITPDPSALGEWTEGDWATLLELGMTPSGDFVGSGMGRVVEEGTAKLSAEDRAAIITYLMSIPPIATEERSSPSSDDIEEDDW